MTDQELIIRCLTCEQEVRKVCACNSPATAEMTAEDWERLHAACGNQDLLTMLTLSGYRDAPTHFIEAITEREEKAYALGFADGEMNNKLPDPWSKGARRAAIAESLAEHNLEHGSEAEPEEWRTYSSLEMIGWLALVAASMAGLFLVIHYFRDWIVVQ